MKYKVIICLLLAIVFSACKKSNDAVPSSASIVGSWKLAESYNITIAGTQKTEADIAKPILLNFNTSLYSEATSGTVTRSGTYLLLDKYQYYPGYYASHVLKTDTVIRGTYAIHVGKPDTLLINSINQGPDNGSGSVYLRVK
ncbi:hypothetical protein [Mucilaginibacter polytrichastri]|uniref:Lipocalin-like domain-containing protein n=1 Tax=Mucilaginibacter polytrichastri TaxID=1302689 RepID=A0A1Q5ZZ65_9SPHI|nr:hypothetical protein [Mucilaginibacter polytrichastri]OKS87037.1 hypothetical protein RG47T_2496 [Mucilaginibacter polytrichastri]SFS86331.1 hypothetical protein SAMN04487890_105105 [Mucilaginibacter polytrichastri]